MPDHWDFALSHARGQRITFVCDDDALLPDALQYADAEFDRHPEMDGLVFGLARYIHPDTLPGHPANTLCMRVPSSATRRGDAEAELAHMASGGAENTVPKMLNCFVTSDAVETIRDRMGRCFPPSCPDYSFAAAFMLCGLEFRICDRVLALWGVSKSSVGVSAATGQGSSVAGFVDEFEEDPIPYSRVKCDLIPAHVSSTALAAAELCGATLPFDVVEFYGNLFDSCEYRERTTGPSPTRQEIWRALEAEPPAVRDTILAALRLRGCRGLTPLDRLGYGARCTINRLRDKLRTAIHRSDALQNLKTRMRPLPDGVQPNGERALAGSEYGFAGIADAAANYRTLERKLFREDGSSRSTARSAPATTSA